MLLSFSYLQQESVIIVDLGKSVVGTITTREFVVNVKMIENNTLQVRNGKV